MSVIYWEAPFVNKSKAKASASNYLIKHGKGGKEILTVLWKQTES